MENIKIEILKNLTEGYSRQSKTSNQFWITLIITSIITITAQPDNINLVELPFTLGKVNTADFYSVVLILICVLSIAYASAMIQAIRCRMLIQKVIDISETKLLGSIHIQDIVDCMLLPTYNRVAPISQYLLGKKQFYSDPNPNKFIKTISSVFYFILKLTTYIFLYLVPIYSIYISWKNIQIHTSGNLNINSLFYIVLIIITLIVLLIVIISDFKYLTRVTKRIKN